MSRHRTVSDSQRGEGAVGCLVVLLLAVVFGYISFKVIPVYIDSMNFDEDLAREASRAGANLWTDDKIRDDVQKMAAFRNFRIEPGGLVITRMPSVPPEVRIEVRYRTEVVFPGYTRVFHFQSKASSLVGSF